MKYGHKQQNKTKNKLKIQEVSFTSDRRIKEWFTKNKLVN